MIVTFLRVNELKYFYATDYNNMSKLLNRILEVEVELHNLIFKYRQTSNIRGTLLGNKIVDHPDVVGASLLQLHLHTWLNTWLQWTGQSNC